MGFADFKASMLSGAPLAGTFIKTPAYEIIEFLQDTGLDFLCLDAEHAPFDRARLDACLAISRALDFPTLVRVPAATPENLLQVLDAGALGVVCPHIDTVEKARSIALAGRFGDGGRGYAGSTRWAGLTRRPMKDVLAQSLSETIVIAQIEEPAGVERADDIAAVEGVDGLFIGPADLTVAYGETEMWSDRLMEAYKAVGAACRKHGKANMTFVATPEQAVALRPSGVSMFFIGSEVGWMAEGARAAAAAIHASE